MEKRNKYNIIILTLPNLLNFLTNHFYFQIEQKSDYKNIFKNFEVIHRSLVKKKSKLASRSQDKI